MAIRNPKKLQIEERRCAACGKAIVLAVTLPDGRSVRRHPGRGGEGGRRIFCDSTCRTRELRKRRAKA